MNSPLVPFHLSPPSAVRFLRGMIGLEEAMHSVPSRWNGTRDGEGRSSGKLPAGTHWWARCSCATAGRGHGGSGLAPKDSNLHSRIQSPVSCRWTRGQRRRAPAYNFAMCHSPGNGAGSEIGRLVRNVLVLLVSLTPDLGH